MGWCKANFAACVRLYTPSRQVAHMRATFRRSQVLWKRPDGADHVSAIIP